MSLKAVWKSILKATELGAKPSSGRAPVYIHEIDTPKLETTLSASSTPAVTKAASGAITLAGGSATLDLTAAPHPSGTTIDFTGLRLRRIELRARATNSAEVVIAADIVNGYAIKLSETLAAGDHVGRAYETNLGAVGSTAKRIGLSSADADAIVDFVIVGG